jgi:hypothetical protein
MPYATLEALRAAVPASGSTDHEDHTRGIVDALIAGVRKATVTLSSADILDLHNTPVEVVAAPGAGRFLVPHLVIASTSGGTTPYTVPDAVSIQVGDASWVEVSSLFSVVTGEQVATFIPAAVTFAAADVENRSIAILATDDNPTDGDGTLTVTVWYSIEDVP